MTNKKPPKKKKLTDKELEKLSGGVVRGKMPAIDFKRKSVVPGHTSGMGGKK